MSYPMKEIAFLAALTLVAHPASATSLTWDADPSTPGAQPGDGMSNLGEWTIWDTDPSNLLWWNGSANVSWVNDGSVTAVLIGENEVVQVRDDLFAAGIDFQANQELSIAQAPGTALNGLLRVTGDVSAGGFINPIGKIGNGRYQPGLLECGIRFEGGTTIELAADIGDLSRSSSPSFQVYGEGTVVRFTGFWDGDGDGTITSLAPREGGRWIITEEAEMDFIQSFGGFTRQLWVYGDGTGVLELEEGFVADLSEGGTKSHGIGAIRLSNAILETHHSQSLPRTFRRRCNGVAGPNGHFVFEDQDGSIWRPLTNPQTYDSAMWFFASGIIDAQVPVTHTGITWRNFSTCDGHTYTMANAFQTNENNVTITKRGPETLTLAGEIAFKPGGVLHVEEGGVDMRTDPAAGGTRPSGSVVGPNMSLLVDEGAWHRFGAASSELEDIVNDGCVILEGAQTYAQSFGTSFTQSATGTLSTMLGSHALAGVSQLVMNGSAQIGGTLLVTRQPGHLPAVGTSRDALISYFGSVTGAIALDDRTGLGLTLQIFGNRVAVTTTTDTPGEWFDYDVWAADHYSPGELADDAVSGPDAAAKGYGTNLFRYSLDLPEDGDDLGRRPAIVWVEGAAQFELYVNPRKLDLRTIVEGSVNGVDWDVLYDSEEDPEAAGMRSVETPGHAEDRYFFRPKWEWKENVPGC